MLERRKNSQKTRSKNLAQKPNYDSLGRSDTNTFKDIRSASVDKKRTKKRNRKYYEFYNVKAGQLGLDHYHFNATPSYPLWQDWPADKSDLKVVKLNKKQLFDTARATIPSTMYRCSYYYHRNKYVQRDAERRQVDAKAEAEAWVKGDLFSELDSNGALEDWITYDTMGWQEAEDDFNAEGAEFLTGPTVSGGKPEPVGSTVGDFATLIEKAMHVRDEKIRVEIEGQGWMDVGFEAAESPELGWVADGVDLLGLEEFVLI
ncbi:hypothetical protein EJ08DRAFT_450713 [Tothia fuscella]|uniref:Uncharacterized protein n=1 Tax=Tothia fuscella TaxID=1048955 RepID=A0A9P4TUS3_9PEZI|nr:hypothetical protein EJ08DRAFT_450713 [Tothia fuscella]